MSECCLNSLEIALKRKPGLAIEKNLFLAAADITSIISLSWHVELSKELLKCVSESAKGDFVPQALNFLLEHDEFWVDVFLEEQGI